MSTSLAEQLKRLQTPQTSQFVDSKKRDSILFSSKEAATKSRETIYEIGISGFNALVEINPLFSEFESTLFEFTSKDVQRAVETKEFNEKLNSHIKKFLYHLSPYFMMPDAHKCLEWMIRRFNINIYNRDEFMMLALPYHQTNIFVRCVQTMKFTDETDKWNFLADVKNSSSPLSKYSLFNHGASQPSFLGFIGKFTHEALKELGVKAGSLQTMLAFYCTTTIGSLEHAPRINENHILQITKYLIKTYKSNVMDFVAAGYMITAQLLVKVKLSVKLLDQLMNKITTTIHPALSQNVILLLSLMFQSQVDTLKITDATLENLINLKWLIPALEEMKKDGKPFTNFYRALICKLLEKIGAVDDDFLIYKSFCEKLMKEIYLEDDEAEIIIKSILDSYIVSPEVNENGNGKSKMEIDEDAVIDLSSDEEEENIPLKPQDVTAWYSQFLKSLERSYPNAFDNVVKEVMTTSPGRRRNGLRNILGFLLKMSCANNEQNIFENLYHHNAEQRQAAVEFLVENFDNLMIKNDESSDILKITVLERLNDENSDVVLKVLEISTSNLLSLIGPEDLMLKLTKLFMKFWKNQERWGKVCIKALTIVTSQEVANKCDGNLILAAILPFLFPNDEVTKNLYRLVKDSKFAKDSKFIAKLPKSMKSVDEVLEVLATSAHLPTSESILSLIENCLLSDKKIASLTAQFSFLLLAHSLGKKEMSSEQSLKVIKMIKNVLSKNRLSIVNGEIASTSHLHLYEVPVQTIALLMEKLLQLTNFENHLINFSNPSNEDQLKLEVFGLLVDKFFSYEPTNPLRSSFNSILKVFLDKVCDSKHEIKLAFFSQFCASHIVYREDNGESLELQIRSMRLLSFILSTNKNYGKKYPNEFYFNILIALSSDNEMVREIAMEIIGHLIEHDNAKQWKYLIEKLNERRSEILMDSQQLSLILFLLSGGKGTANLKIVIESICAAVAEVETFDFIQSGLLDAIKHLNDKKVIEVMSTVALDIIQSEKDEVQRFSDSESRILKIVLMKINETTVATNLLTLVKTAIECHRLMFNEDGKFMTPSLLVLKAIDENVFKKLSPENRMEIIQQIVKCSMRDQAKIVTAAQKCFQLLPIEFTIVKIFLSKMPRLEPSTQRKKDKTIVQNPLTSDVWKFNVSLLELLQNRTKQMKNFHELIPLLFDLLDNCLHALPEWNVEYVKQIVLSLLLDICQNLTKDGKSLSTFGLQESSLKPELVVKCIKESENPQTHHHALLLLAQLALMTPDQVLNDMMAIFTFVGTTLARHEDSYSFQIIAKIIENIVPTITRTKRNEAEIIAILKIFASIVLNVPEHRRLMIFDKLLRTLGEDKYLWIFVGLVLQQQVVNHKKGTSQDELPPRLQCVISLTKEFDLKTILEASSSLIAYLKKLPMFIDTKPGTVPFIQSEEQKEIFSVKTHTDVNLRHFKYLVLQFLKNLLSSPELQLKVRRMTPEDKMELKGQFQDIILNVLTLIPEISKALEHQKMKPFEKSWHVILQNSFDILESSIELLEADMLIVVVENLMLHDFLLVRKKVLELLNRKLEENYFDKVDDKKLVKLLEPLRTICDTIGDEDSSIALEVVQQTSLMSIKLLARKLSEENPEEFVEILGDLTQLLENEKIKIAVKVNLIVCIAELTADLKVQAISQLGNFMPHILKLLTVHDDAAGFLLLYSVVSAILRIIETVSLFLSPYLVQIISHLCRLAHPLKFLEDSKISLILAKITKIWSTTASLVPKRVLIPYIEEVYGKMMVKNNYECIEPLMELLHEVIKQTEMKDLKNYTGELTEFFMKSLKIRSEISNDKNVDDIENCVMKSFIAMTLKLSEGSFRPLFEELHNWALREDPTDFNRAITFFRLTAEISGALKSLFLLFASDVVDCSGPLLDKCNSTKSDENCFDDDEKNLYLASFILKTLHNIFLHDHQNFINSSRFEIIMQPIVDMIENEEFIANEEHRETLTLTIAQLPCSASDDILWKQLNYQILMKTRSDSTAQRILGLKICVEMAKKLGQSFESLLPETIPFLSELLEDEDYKVVEATQNGVRELEETVGESLQKHF